MSSAGIPSALEQWSNADFSLFQLILGWFLVGKCRFTNVVHLPSKEHLFLRSYLMLNIVRKVSYALGGNSMWPGTAVKC
jgi:hypothetical protein